MSRMNLLNSDITSLANRWDFAKWVVWPFVLLATVLLPVFLGAVARDYAPLLVGTAVAERGTMFTAAVSYAALFLSYPACLFANNALKFGEGMRQTSILAVVWLGLLSWLFAPSISYFIDMGLSSRWVILKYELARVTPDRIFSGRAMNGATAIDGGLVLVSIGIILMKTREFSMWWRRGGNHRDIEKTTGSAETAVLPDATWAPKERIKDRLRAKGGIVLGEDTNPLTESPDFQSFDQTTWGRQGKGDLIQIDAREGNGHTLVVSPSGSFKTSGILIPNIHEYEGPIFVVDPKCDLYARCHEHRKSMGREIILIDAENGLDPLSLIFPLAQSYPTLYIAIANAICPPVGQVTANSEYFRNSAARLLTALMAYAVRSRVNDVPEYLMKLVNMPQKVFAGMAEQIPDDEEQKFIKAALLEVAQMDNKQYSGVKGEVFNNLQFLTMPDARKYITNPKNRRPINLTDLFKPNTDVFINVSDMIVEHHPAMIRLFFTTIVLAMRMLTQPDNPPARRLFMMDEAAMLKGMEILKTLRNVGRGYGIHLMLIYQTIGQIEEIWGPHEFSSWFDTMHNKIIGSMENPDGSAKFAQMFGQHTVTTTTMNENRSRPDYQLFAGQTGESAQTQLKEVPLFAQHRLASLGPWGSIIKITGHQPILASKAIYRTRPEMVKNIRSEEEIADQMRPPALEEDKSDPVKKAQKDKRDQEIFNLKPLQEREERNIRQLMKTDPIKARDVAEQSPLLTHNQRVVLISIIEKVIAADQASSAGMNASSKDFYHNADGKNGIGNSKTRNDAPNSNSADNDEI